MSDDKKNNQQTEEKPKDQAEGAGSQEKPLESEEPKGVDWKAHDDELSRIERTFIEEIQKLPEKSTNFVLIMMPNKNGEVKIHANIGGRGDRLMKMLASALGAQDREHPGWMVRFLLELKREAIKRKLPEDMPPFLKDMLSEVMGHDDDNPLSAILGGPMDGPSGLLGEILKRRANKGGGNPLDEFKADIFEPESERCKSCGSFEECKERAAAAAHETAEDGDPALVVENVEHIEGDSAKTIININTEGGDVVLNND